MTAISNLPPGVKIKITKLHPNDCHFGTDGIVGEVFESSDIGKRGSTYFRRMNDGEEFCFYNKTEYELLTDQNKDKMKLEITADKVKEAAAKCPQAEATLKTLFPEVFDDDINLVDESGIDGRALFLKDGDADDAMISVWGGSAEQFYLSNKFNWEIINHNYDYQTLIPTKK